MCWPLNKPGSECAVIVQALGRTITHFVLACCFLSIDPQSLGGCQGSFLCAGFCPRSRVWLLSSARSLISNLCSCLSVWSRPLALVPVPLIPTQTLPFHSRTLSLLLHILSCHSGRCRLHPPVKALFSPRLSVIFLSSDKTKGAPFTFPLRSAYPSHLGFVAV